MAFENALFSYGGELGDMSTYKVDGIINSPKAVAALDAYKKLYSFTPPGWAKTFFVKDNPASKPNAANTGFFANPAGPDGDQFAALGGQGISVISYSQNQEKAMKFLKWFIQDDTQKEWAKLGGYTCSKAVLESTEFRNATPYNQAFYQTMFKVKDFCAVPE